MSELDIPALICIFVFYALIAAVGAWAVRRTRNQRSAKSSDTIIVGAKDIGLFLGICTVTATWVGGGAINGTAETVYSPYLGLIWCVGTLFFGLSLVIAALFFIKRMREKNYLTVLDPFEKTLGKYFAAFYFCVEAFGGIIFAAAILNALGGTIEVVSGLSRVVAIILSAAIAILYTLFGGIYAVAFTDVIQLFLMLIGLVLVVPFAISNEAVSSISETFATEGGWSGTWDSSIAGPYIDTIFVPLLGGVPVQIVFQRLLAIDTTRNAQIVGVAGGVITTFILIPPILIGAVGASTNWTLTTYLNGTGTSPADLGNEIQILPIVMKYLTPAAVGYIGLGAVTAAVMSSADSAALSFGGEFTRNLYVAVIRPKASSKEIMWAFRISILVFGIASATMAIQVPSIMTLFLLSADFLYVLTFPQFVCSLYLDTNAYGTLVGICLGIIIRIGGGEFLLNIPGPFNYVGGNRFPVKTVAMLTTFLTTVIISRVVKWLFVREYIPSRYDVLKAGFIANGKNSAGSRNPTFESNNVELEGGIDGEQPSTTHHHPLPETIVS